ncbi:MAG: 5-formyltetrahydrofolate cyclo-ligase [Coxiella endosymbiont of Haemaphysalis qinghaiensis]
MNSLPHKKQLRALLRHRRNVLSFSERSNASQAVCNKIEIIPSLFETSQNLAFYRAHDGEVNIDNALKKAQAIGKNCYLPVLHSSQNHLDFYSFHLEDLLIKNHFGIEEPDIFQEKPISVVKLDLIFLPLVAFDKKGNRLGRGAGHYDRALAPLKNKTLKKPVLVGIAYEFQKIDETPFEKWDVPLNFVITEKIIYRF